jgi:hypothetical protein
MVGTKTQSTGPAPGFDTHRGIPPSGRRDVDGFHESNATSSVEVTDVFIAALTIVVVSTVKMSSECNKCNTKCTDEVCCDLCRKMLHPEYASVSKSKAINLRAKNRKINFYCENCDIVGMIRSFKTQIQSLSEEITSLKKIYPTVIALISSRHRLKKLSVNLRSVKKSIQYYCI